MLFHPEIINGNESKRKWQNKYKWSWYIFFTRQRYRDKWKRNQIAFSRTKNGSNLIKSAQFQKEPEEAF